MKITVVNGEVVPTLKKGWKLCLLKDCIKSFFPLRATRKYCCVNHAKLASQRRTRALA